MGLNLIHQQLTKRSNKPEGENSHAQFTEQNGFRLEGAERVAAAEALHLENGKLL
jgi:hypothetical protein